MGIIQCDRCGATPDQYQEAIDDVRLQEMNLAAGIIACLCYKCRNNWSRFALTNAQIQKYSLQNFRLRMHEHRAKRSKGNIDVTMLEGYFKDMTDSEVCVAEEVDKWINDCKKVSPDDNDNASNDDDYDTY